MTGILGAALRRLYKPKPLKDTMPPAQLHDPSPPDHPGVTVIGALHDSIDEHERVASEEATRYEMRLHQTMAAINDVFDKLGTKAHG